MELRQYFNVVLKWWWLIVAAMIVAGVAAFLGSQASPRTYLSRTTLMVGQALQNPNPSQSDFYTAQALAQSYTDLVKREPVLRGALDTLGLPWHWTVLQSMVSSRVVPGTLLLEIGVLDTDPQRAKVLADAVADQLILQSPAGVDPEREAERKFVQEQIESLKSKIQKGEQEIRQLDDTIATATSARQIQDARSRQSEIQAQISTWQATFAQMTASLQRGSTNFISIVEHAQTPSAPTGSGAASNVLLAAAIALVLSAGAAFIMEYLDDSIKTTEDVSQITHLITLGTITRIDGTDSVDMLITLLEPRSPAAESYRMLRTNLQYSSVDNPLRTLMITSANPEEGKSVTAANIAIVMAQSGKRTILVDADMRRPQQELLFNLKSRIGLTSLLTDPQIQPSDALLATSVENLKIILAGTQPPNPSELLGSKRMSTLIEKLTSEAEVVIFDSPPVMAVSDATVLAPHVDGTLLVIDSGKTRRGAARQSADALNAVGARLLGAVLNRAPAQSRRYAYYYTDGGKRQRRSLLRRRGGVRAQAQAEQGTSPSATSAAQERTAQSQ